MELVLPSTKYRDSFLSAASEFLAEDAARYKDTYDVDATDDFNDFVKKRRAMSKGEGLPRGWVPVTEYWLVKGNNYIGRVSIRHVLNQQLLAVGGHIGYNIRRSERRKGYGKKVLELALLKARKLGLKKVLLTCDETNEASRKIIEANGGVLEDKYPDQNGGPDKLRYWIQL